MATATLEKAATMTNQMNEKPAAKTQMSSRATLARRARDAAAKFLEARGYDILERDWAFHSDQIDIIARQDDTLVFIDVSFRCAPDAGFPKEFTGNAVRKRFEKIALAYITQHDHGELRVRYDTVAVVVLGDSRALIRHHVNALTIG